AKAAEDIRDQAAGFRDEFPENGGSVAWLAFAAGLRDEVPSASSPLVPICLVEHDAPGLGERRLDAERGQLCITLFLHGETGAINVDAQLAQCAAGRLVVDDQ